MLKDKKLIGISLNIKMIKTIARNSGLVFDGCLDGGNLDFIDNYFGLRNMVRVCVVDDRVIVVDKTYLNSLIMVCVDLKNIRSMNETIRNIGVDPEIDYLDYWYNEFKLLIDTMGIDPDTLYVNFYDYILGYISDIEHHIRG